MSNPVYSYDFKISIQFHDLDKLNELLDDNSTCSFINVKRRAVNFDKSRYPEISTRWFDDIDKIENIQSFDDNHSSIEYEHKTYHLVESREEVESAIHSTYIQAMDEFYEENYQNR